MIWWARPRNIVGRCHGWIIGSAMREIVGGDWKAERVLSASVVSVPEPMRGDVVAEAARRACDIGRHYGDAVAVARAEKPGQACVPMIAANMARARAESWILRLSAIARAGHADMTDDDIKEAAKGAARHVLMVMSGMRTTAANVVVDRMRAACDAAGVRAPRVSGGVVGPMVARMTCEKWWRRALRRRVGLAAETVARSGGLVGRGRDLYISDETMGVMMARWRRFALAARDALVESDAGDCMSLADAIAASVSNPELRRKELMTRIRGCDEYARSRGWVGMAATLTAPSRFHVMAGHEKKQIKAGNSVINLPVMRENARYDGSTPLDAHAWLMGQWRKFRSWLKRSGIESIMLRVAEPHHEGCPHWHVMILCEKGDRRAVAKTLIAYWRTEDGEELEPAAYGGSVAAADRAKRARCYIKAIRQNAMSSCAGYFAKYISKGIDGTNSDGEVFDHDEGGVKSQEGALRIRAWASRWGIRQYSFVGAAKVGPWRELRRVRDGEAVPESMKMAWMCADGGDWCGWEKAGKPGTLKESATSRYGDVVMRVVGVVDDGGDLVTRKKKWRLTWRASSVLVAPSSDCLTDGTAAGFTPSDLCQ